ncbi:MAG: 30S ribosomal protein S27e [Candidatus Thermoplasmatota archaeon]|nr:30S ribosomal protein S27e [Candidatus Thermoplasmatota archaeon]
MADKKFIKVRKIKGKFIKIKCPDCNSEQVTFVKASSHVNCSVCGAKLAEPTGGNVAISGEIVGEI